MSEKPLLGYTIGLLGAVGVHALILFGIKSRDTGDYTPPEFGVAIANTGVEVDLVAALPAEEVVEAAVEEPEQPEMEPEPEPEPEPELPPEPEPPEPLPEPVTPPEMPVPEATPAPTPEPEQTPATPQPTPKPTPAATPKPKPKPKPSPQASSSAQPTNRSASGDGSSAIPGSDATTAAAATGALSAQPGYLRNPHPAYPEEARKAGQQGVVHLRVQLDERGSILSVSLSRSSGYPLLDERALSTVREKWRFKPARRGRAAVASDVVIPIRFTLNR